MPPRLSLRPVARRKGLFLNQSPLQATSLCLFCSLSAPQLNPIRRRSRKALTSQRFESTTSPGSKASANPRADLEETLLLLQKHAVNYVNLSRLQLALQGLRQTVGEESVRVAILGLSNGVESGKAVKELLRLLLADPLKAEEEWEKQLASHDPRQPLIVRVGHEKPEDAGTLTISKTNLLHELHISSTALNGLNIELLLTEVNPFSGAPGENSIQEVEDAVLVPTVHIPSNTGRYTPITTPIHKALLVTEGIMGASSIASLPLVQSKDTVLAAVDLHNYDPEDASQLTFQPINIGLGAQGLSLFRQSISNGIEYEHLWYQSNLPNLLEWLKAGVQAEGNATKPAVRKLIASLLQNTSAAIQTEESRRLSGLLSSKAASPGLALLNKGLADWAQVAHTELQDQLDLAFAGRRWRKLGWWKLFWRVDDVGMLTSDMLNQRFLPGAERELIYLAGRIDQSGVVSERAAPEYSQPLPSVVEIQAVSPSKEAVKQPVLAIEPQPKWPTHIAFTRRYLQDETVPALQALAQKLVLQSTSTSALTTSLAALLYVSSFASTLYEAGAVAALGIVWSLRRLQKKWETAREFWEGEVREEGRKAVRGVENSVAEVLDASHEKKAGIEGADELREARELVAKAEDALARMK